MSVLTEMPFNGVSNEDLILIFPKEGDNYKGHSYINGCWYIFTECDDDGNFYNEYSDEDGNWHYIDYGTI